jgi:hypothetical protein
MTQCQRPSTQFILSAAAGGVDGLGTDGCFVQGRP